MARLSVCICTVALASMSATAHADWTLYADAANGVVSGINPSLAIAPNREIFLAVLAPQFDAEGAVYRADLEDSPPVFTKMPAFKLPTPPQGIPYNNVGALITNALGEPVVGISTNGNWVNTEPMLYRWDEAAATWHASVISPKDAVCNHNIYKLARAPNGDLWATCQWHGAYRSTDDGQTFDYVDVSASVAAKVPGYFPTRANGAGDLGALYGLAIGADGNVYIGSESGGVVYSADDGATWAPLDWAPTDPMSTMAQATNLLNIAGVGVTADGRVLAQGANGNAPYPPDSPAGFFIFDPVAHTTTTGVGFPDYLLLGLTVAQIPRMPSGQLFLHTGHDSVDKLTGEPAFGGIMTSMDGISWVQDNAGIDEVYMIPNMNMWIDGNGRADAHPFATDDGDIYTMTTSGKIFKQSTGPGGGDTTSGTDTDDPATTSTTNSTGSGTDASDSAAPTSTASTDPVTTGTATTDANTTGPTPTTDGSGTTSAPAEGDSGCGCRSEPTHTAPWLALGLCAGLAARRRRRP